jgi:hypothetical protein
VTSAQESTSNRLARVMNDASTARRPKSTASDDSDSADRGVSAVA